VAVKDLVALVELTLAAAAVVLVTLKLVALAVQVL
jgi:hypothetical protein